MLMEEDVRICWSVRYEQDLEKHTKLDYFRSRNLQLVLMIVRMTS